MGAIAVPELSHYCVVDVETTGLSPSGDRVVSLGMVFCDQEAGVLATWYGLFNPGRDTGPVNVHGITNADVADAPEFAEVAEMVGEALEGLVLVAHYVSFDAGFLQAEFARAEVDWPAVEQRCTLAWARRLQLGVKSNSLGSLAEYFGIPTWQAHNALEDALAAAALLAKLLAREGGW